MTSIVLAQGTSGQVNRCPKPGLISLGLDLDWAGKKLVHLAAPPLYRADAWHHGMQTLIDRPVGATSDPVDSGIDVAVIGAEKLKPAGGARKGPRRWSVGPTNQG